MEDHLPPPQDPETIRRWDRRAIEEFGIPGVVLMENAGAGAARRIASFLEREPTLYPKPVVVLCGPGQNGGDGFVIARHLWNRHIPVEVHLTFARDRVDPASPAGIQLATLGHTRVPIHVDEPGFPAPEVVASPVRVTVVDALLGTGLRRPLRDPVLSWVRAVNAARHTVVSIDVPTGLDPATGAVLGAAIRARRTLTFAAAKTGFALGEGPPHCGTVDVLDIGMPREIWEEA